MQLQNKPVVKRITPPQRLVFPDFQQVWQYREMLLLFIWRDFSTRYRQTLIGIGWFAITPLVSMVIFSIFFGEILKVPSNGIPYPIFSYAGLLPWTLFVTGTSKVSSSLLANSYLINKIYFPRLIIPFSTLIFGILDFLVSLVILVAMIFGFGYIPTLNVVFLPFFILVILVASLGIGLWFASLSIQFRDAAQILGFALNILFYATPVIYPSTLLTDKWLTLYSLNPMVGVIEGFRWALLDTPPPATTALLFSSGLTALILISGIFYFTYAEQFFSDVV